MTPLQEIADERARQKWSEHWTTEHDDKHTHAELSCAAAAYAMPPHVRKLLFSSGNTVLDRLWPWDWNWWKPKDRRRDLIRAGALIVAEIERLDRAAQQKAA